MKSQFVSKKGNCRLLLIFAGWGMDHTPFSTLHRSGYDIAVIYNYTDFNPDICSAMVRQLSKAYDETVVIAWSFGVRIAHEILLQLRSSKSSITRAIAVNGTPMHIHEIMGIPPDIFHATLQGLSEQSVEKFYRRMFSHSTEFAQFATHRPERSLDSLVSELTLFASLPPLAPDPTLWDIVIISDSDRIVPATNQHRAWNGTPVETLHDAPHFPDFQAIADRYVVDKELVARRFASALSTYAGCATVQSHTAQKLWQMCSSHITHLTAKCHPEVLEVGYGNGTLTDIYSQQLPDIKLTLWDIARLPLPAGAPPDAASVCCDAETAIKQVPPEKFDLVLSASAMQWFHSPEQFIRNVAHTLTPGGIAAFALYGHGTYSEIKTISGQALTYPEIDRLKTAACESCLNPLLCCEESHTMEFDSVSDMLRHLKHTGVNALAAEPETARKAAIKLMKTYPLTPRGKAPLTYCPIYLILQKSYETYTHQ